MQISSQEVEKVLRRASRRSLAADRPAGSVEELAEKYGVDQTEVSPAVDTVRMAEEDPWRERRVREIAARVQAGAYDVSGDEITDMAERRAVADRAAEL